MIGIRRVSTTPDRKIIPFRGVFWLAIMAFSSGCAICAGPFDCHYPTYGGRWQRGHPSAGRVGSAFQPTGEVVLHPGETFVSAEGVTAGEGGWLEDDDWGEFEGWGPPDVDWEGEDPALPEEPEHRDSPDWATIMGD